MGKRFADSSEKVEYWTAAVELFRQSGLSCTEFCNREGLSYSTFCRWRDKLWRQPDPVEPSKSSSASPAVVSPDVDKPDDKARFVSAGVVEFGRTQQTAGVEVSFATGVSINVQKGFDRKVFRDVVAILGAELC